jgi:hypothetical protein
MPPKTTSSDLLKCLYDASYTCTVCQEETHYQESRIPNNQDLHNSAANRRVTFYAAHAMKTRQTIRASIAESVDDKDQRVWHSSLSKVGWPAGNTSTHIVPNFFVLDAREKYHNCHYFSKQL